MTIKTAEQLEVEWATSARWQGVQRRYTAAGSDVSA